ncbi:hypothetical protein ACXZ66_06730 [Corynebacterium sp. S7]
MSPLSDTELALIKKHYGTKRKAVLTGIAAARAMGLKTLSRLTIVEFYLPDGVNAPPRKQWSPGTKYFSTTVPVQVHVADPNLRVTSAIQTLLHLNRHHGELECLVAMDSARLQWDSLSLATLHQRADSLKNSIGLPAFRETIELSQAGMGSPLETIARYRLIKADLPGIRDIRFQVKVEITDAEKVRHVFYVDQLINSYLVVEIDGRTKYDGTYGEQPAAVIKMERDRERLLRSAGFIVIRTYHDGLKQEPDGSCAFIREVHRTLETVPPPKIMPKTQTIL